MRVFCAFLGCIYISIEHKLHHSVDNELEFDIQAFIWF
jgi:hypothetical protein